MLWYIVVSTLAAAVFVFGSMAFVPVYRKKAAEAPRALVTTALGGIVGLVATSPGRRRLNGVSFEWVKARGKMMKRNVRP